MTNVLIEKGVKKLDKKIPGWDERIDIDLLDLGSDYDCVLGQLYGSYYSGRRELEDMGVKVGEKRMVKMGFFRESRHEYKSLDEAWREEILSRRS